MSRGTVWGKSPTEPNADAADATEGPKSGRLATPARTVSLPDRRASRLRWNGYKIGYLGILGFGLATSMATAAFAGSTTVPASYTDLGTFGGTISYASDVSADGSVVVGQAWTTNDNAGRAFRWTASSNTMVDLGTLGGIDSAANAVSDDGSVVVGRSYTTNTVSYTHLTLPTN